jgi:hypothetical protein
MPTRNRFVQAFLDAAKAKANDLLVVYLAGHGVNYGGQDGDFYYLTMDATSGSLEDPAVRAANAISSHELTEWINAIPALKQVLILDTCASGRMIEKLTVKRDIASSQIRSLERMKDRTGLYILAGAAADAVSYEASRYGQGLLTWSLLFGMHGAALRESQFVDVSRLFNHVADQVPRLAQDIGGIQRPVIAMPKSGASFDFGQILDEDKLNCIHPAQVRPLILQANFQDDEKFQDHLKLSKLINTALRKASAGVRDARFIFVEADDLPNAYSLAGRYRIVGSMIKVKVLLFEDNTKKEVFDIAGDKERLDELVDRIIVKVEQLLTHQPG